MSQFNEITVDMIIESIVSDLANPNLKGNYELQFIAESPLFGSASHELGIQVSEEGVPTFAIPKGMLTPEDFSRRLQAIIGQEPGKFKDTLIVLTKVAAEPKTWTWQLQNNGHLTPYDIKPEAKQNGVNPVDILNYNMGWTINHSAEILLFVYEGLRLIELGAKYAEEHDLNRFNIVFNLDRIHNSYFVTKKSDGVFALDKDDYMKVFTAFKNGAYLSEKFAYLTLSFPNKNKFRWDDKDGVLVGVETQYKQAGWDIGFDKKDAEALMDFLTKQENAEDETVNPDKVNQPLTPAQEEFLDALQVTDIFEENQIILYFKTEKSPLLSTAIIDVNGQKIVELPHVLDFVVEAGDEVAVLVQSQNKSKDKNSEPFQWLAFSVNKETVTVLSDSETMALKEELLKK